MAHQNYFRFPEILVNKYMIEPLLGLQHNLTRIRQDFFYFPTILMVPIVFLVLVLFAGSGTLRMMAILAALGLGGYLLVVNAISYMKYLKVKKEMESFFDDRFFNIITEMKDIDKAMVKYELMQNSYKNQLKELSEMKKTIVTPSFKMKLLSMTDDKIAAYKDLNNHLNGCALSIKTLNVIANNIIIRKYVDSDEWYLPKVSKEQLLRNFKQNQKMITQSIGEEDQFLKWFESNKKELTEMAKDNDNQNILEEAKSASNGVELYDEVSELEMDINDMVIQNKIEEEEWYMSHAEVEQAKAELAELKDKVQSRNDEEQIIMEWEKKYKDDFSV